MYLDELRDVNGTPTEEKKYLFRSLREIDWTASGSLIPLMGRGVYICKLNNNSKTNIGYVYENREGRFLASIDGLTYHLEGCLVKGIYQGDLLTAPSTLVGVAHEIEIESLYNLRTPYNLLHSSYRWALAQFKFEALEYVHDENDTPGVFNDEVVYRLRRPPTYKFAPVHLTYSYQTFEGKERKGTIFYCAGRRFFLSDKLYHAEKTRGGYEIGEPFSDTLDNWFKEGEHPYVEAYAYG